MQNNFWCEALLGLDRPRLKDSNSYLGPWGTRSGAERRGFYRGGDRKVRLSKYLMTRLAGTLLGEGMSFAGVICRVWAGLRAESGLNEIGQVLTAWQAKQPFAYRK